MKLFEREREREADSVKRRLTRFHEATKQRDNGHRELVGRNRAGFNNSFCGAKLAAIFRKRTGVAHGWIRPRPDTTTRNPPPTTPRSKRASHSRSRIWWRTCACNTCLWHGLSDYLRRVARETSLLPLSSLDDVCLPFEIGRIAIYGASRRWFAENGRRFEKEHFSKPVWTELFLVDSSISLSFWFFRRFVVIESCDIRGLMDVHSLPRFRYSYQCYTWLSCTTCLYRSSLFSRWRFVWIQSQYVWIFLKKIILLFFSINWFTWCEIFVEIIAK